MVRVRERERSDHKILIPLNTVGDLDFDRTGRLLHAAPSSSLKPKLLCLKPRAVFVNPVYVPTPANRDTQTPHSGYC
ncbi:hypothetical protein CRYUN_Cryun01aG0206100 [Craigia yunnanensis]